MSGEERDEGVVEQIRARILDRAHAYGTAKAFRFYHTANGRRWGRRTQRTPWITSAAPC